MKRTVPLLIAAITGFVLIVTSFIPPTEDWGDTTMMWFDILAAIAFILGGGSLLRQHLQKISDRARGWGFSAVTIAAFVVTLVVGLGKFGVNPPEKYPTYTWAGQYDEPGSALGWIYEYMYYPLGSTMFALLAAFVASAAFRAFRAKNTEATILLVTAFIVLLGRTYAGVAATAWVDDLAKDVVTPLQPFVTTLRLDRLTGMIMNVFNTAGTRAITIGIALGVMSTSLKVLLGVDRSYLGSEE